MERTTNENITNEISNLLESRFGPNYDNDDYVSCFLAFLILKIVELQNEIVGLKSK